MQSKIRLVALDVTTERILVSHTVLCEYVKQIKHLLTAYGIGKSEFICRQVLL
jgi:ribonucleotide monophosphatase NagD (HAD superfamily)